MPPQASQSSNSTTPPLPPGYMLDPSPSASVPPLPPGYTLDSNSAAPRGGLAGAWDKFTSAVRNPVDIPGFPTVSRQINEVKDLATGAEKNALEVSAPAIAGELYKKWTGQPNQLQQLPGKMVTQGAPLMFGEPETDLEATAGRSTTPASAAESGSGMLSRAMDVAKRRVSDNFLVKGAKDLDYIVRGDGGPETPSAPEPQVPAHWGTGKFGTPVDQWGQRIEPTDPDLEKASSLLYGPQAVQDPAAGLGNIPVRSPGQAGSIADSMSQTSAPQRGSLRQMVNDVGDQVGKGLGASPPPSPKEPIYQRGNLSRQMRASDINSSETGIAPMEINHELVRQHLDEAEEFQHYGLRAIAGGPLKTDPAPAEVQVGDRLGASYKWEDNNPTRQRLPGTSVVGVSPDMDDIDLQEAVKRVGRYDGQQVALVGSDTSLGEGNDVGELLLKRPKVLAVYESGQPNWRQPEDLPQGHTAVQSSALKSYRYIPESNEFHAQYGSGNGTVHVFGDVSPEEAQQFEQAKSKGQAMQQIKNGHPLVAKIINGKRQAVTPTQ